MHSSPIYTPERLVDVRMGHEMKLIFTEHLLNVGRRGDMFTFIISFLIITLLTYYKRAYGMNLSKQLAPAGLPLSLIILALD